MKKFFINVNNMEIRVPFLSPLFLLFDHSTQVCINVIIREYQKAILILEKDKYTSQRWYTSTILGQ